MIRLLSLVLFIFVFISHSVAQQHKTLKVLFLGNSYTYVNNLPQLIKDIALANGDTLLFDSNCPGGHTFNNHFNNATSLSKINAQAWDCVILQAQSQEPSFSPGQVAAQTLPYAIKLDSSIKNNNNCSETVFYETWGRKNGDASNCGSYPPICTYLGMQDRLRASYKLFADTTQSVMAPAGEAWRKSIAQNPTLELYSSDQSHPSLEGSYLTACVFYETLFHKSVLSNTYTAGVSSTNVNFLQQIAHDVVNDSLLTWNIGKYNPCNITGVNTISSNKNITLYPNPTHDVLYSNTSSSFKIYDVLGNLCLSGEKAKTVNIESLKSGVYFIELSSLDSTQKIRFVKE
ncbi:MAG: T9SS type A sorting domain-containing protein [Bacteroidia bacterium]|nr:T9SS type A sorting domain-containing protein [Bacteroidia bacterium]